MFNSGNNLSRGSTMLSPDMPPLPQYLPLEPIILGNPKFTRLGELRRVFGVPYGSTSEDHSFGVAHPKPPPPVATEELKHFKESVQDASRKARDRAKMLRESIFKLDKYREALSKKRQRSDLSSSERSGGVNLAKMGSQIHRNSHDTMAQRLEDRTKSVVLNKRVRTSVADVRVDSRSAATSRQQMVAEKDGDLLQAVTGGSVRFEEKTRRLLAGGEGLDQKIKKKRSVGAVGNRVINGDQDIKRATHPKLSTDSKLRSCDAQGFRLKPSPGINGIKKLDSSFDPATSDTCTVLKNELESAALLRDRTVALEQRLVAKGSNKSNTQEDNPAGSPNTVIKGKVSRAPRTGSIMGLDSSLNVNPSSGPFQGWEQPTTLNKVSVVGVTNNQKRTMSTGSSIHPMAQWVGQRPHNSRTRRANVVSPVPNNVESHISSQGFATSDFSAKTSSIGTNGILLASSVDNNTPKVKREIENVLSPLGLSESEESGACENKLKEKGIDSGEVALTAAHKAGAFALTAKKNKIPPNEIGDGVRRQGRSGRGPSLTRPTIPPIREKLENPPMTKSLQSMRPGSEKNRSKSGRPPSKKLKDRKALIRVGPIQNNGSSDFTGESDDDCEELLAAANSARNASNLACSGPFWKKMESIFSSVSSVDTSYLKQQLSFAEELDEGLSQMFGIEYNVLGVVVPKEVTDCSGVRQGSQSNRESAETDSLCGRFDMGRLDKVAPLYQRVLSALIEEDEIEEFYHHNEGKNFSLQYASDDSHCGSCNQIDIEPKDRDRMESEVESKVDFQAQKSCLLDRLSCDKSAASNTFRNPSMSTSLHSNEQWRGDDDFLHSDVGHTSEICSNDLGLLQPRELNVPTFSSSDSQYQLLCLDDKLLLELQSIGLYPETLPDLAEGEVINQEIMEHKEGLYQQIGIKKKNLGKIDTAIQKGTDVERRDMEQVAMDQLIGIAYRKQMACRGTHASKSAVRKVSKQVALAFVKRTLARCRKFEDTGNSCFSEPALQDAIFSASPSNNDAKSVDCVGSGTASNTCNEASHQAEARGSGAVTSAFERYDSLSDNVDRGSSDALQTVIHSSEQASSKHGSMFSKVKKREVLIDDVVGSASSRVTSVLDSTVLGGLKGKRIERDGDQNRDNLRSNAVSGVRRSSLDSIRSEHKTKAKPKQKNNHPSTPGSGSHGRFTKAIEPASPPVHGSSQSVANAGNKISRDARSLLPGNIRREASKEGEEPIDFANLQLHELDTELGVSNDLGGPQDLSSWLNFDEDGLQDHDSIGLEIPMDDLSELNLM